MDIKNTRTELMKNAPVKSTLIKLAVPSVIAMLVMALYNFIDTLFVGMLRDTNALAGVSIGFPIFVVVAALGLMVGVGAASYAGRKIGSGDFEVANRTAAIAVKLGIVLGVSTTIFGLIFINPIMRLMGASGAVLPYATEYSTWLFIGATVTVVYMCFNNLLRAEGAANMSMQTLIIGAVINIILDPIFMFDFGLGLGLKGAAIATVIGQLGSLLYVIWYYKTGRSLLKLNKTSFFVKTEFDKEIKKDIFKIGLPVFIMQALSSLAFGLLNIFAATFGSAALATLGIVNKIYMMVLQVIMGYTQAFLPFVSFNAGAKKPERIREATVFSIAVVISISVLSTILFNINPEFFVSMFTKDPEVLLLGVNCLKAQTYLLAAVGFVQLMTSLFQATGNAKAATILSVGRQGIFLIPLIIVLPPLFAKTGPGLFSMLVTYEMEAGLYGIMFAQPIADLISLVLCSLMALSTLKSLKDNMLMSDDEPIAEIINEELTSENINP